VKDAGFKKKIKKRKRSREPMISTVWYTIIPI